MFIDKTRTATITVTQNTSQRTTMYDSLGTAWEVQYYNDSNNTIYGYVALVDHSQSIIDVQDSNGCEWYFVSPGWEGFKMATGTLPATITVTYTQKVSISDQVERLSNVYTNKKLHIYNATYTSQSYNVAAYSGQTKTYTLVWPSNYTYLGAVSATCSGVIGIMVKLDEVRPTGPMNTTLSVWIQNVGPNARSGSNLSIAISCLVLVDY